MSQTWRIRAAEKEDCKEILRLIVELAEYEKMPDQVQMTTEKLEQDGFGDKAYFHCLVAVPKDAQGQEEGRQLLGYALYFYKYSTWEGRGVHMEDLYVTPAWRGRGIGTKLWQAVAKLALDQGCQRLEWTVLDWNTPSLQLYQRRGAVDLTSSEGWHLMRMTPDVMQAFVKDLQQ